MSFTAHMKSNLQKGVEGESKIPDREQVWKWGEKQEGRNQSRIIKKRWDEEEERKVWNLNVKTSKLKYEVDKFSSQRQTER